MSLAELAVIVLIALVVMSPQKINLMLEWILKYHEKINSAIKATRQSLSVESFRSSRKKKGKG